MSMDLALLHYGAAADVKARGHNNEVRVVF